ncbi:4-aminobutyrate--2-oxoglutarate transaminase [Kitasatospora purpeofusca]|uniref:4-aminobutyrate--2-oxoglutarate transaminase n=1 Tax=Kitasatospora purpeofusca TaxID=67352 RepID=UPI0022596290|nr:4-aminobutyrate--2-oxoglutarate transaminase [Kitasatospora purpeofusca]MCX4757798.1 4-aminobutyrate--2-oxoglutarate transaminase [Kitasatospora purpeofusca]WSR34506.1 4-aminobutyrate--2-oxoglutarate transaminase [Kitasatospora purpeofusca]WSR42715.1 4-aminobutyrate--2-oxoglutarate transaminase [Kitasatospora purpeofusca]
MSAATPLPQERRLVTAIPGPKSQELQARKLGAVAAGVGTTLPVYVSRANGGVLEDVDGNSLIDFGSGIAVTNVGNSAEAVVSKASEQLAAFTHTCFMVTPYEGYVAVAEQLNELTPGDHDKRTALFNSGAEAVENAVKIARAYTKRTAVVVFDHGYHGRTNLTMGMTAKNMPYKQGFGPFAPEVHRVPVAYPYRWLTGAENCAAEAAAQAIDIINKQIGAENVAAIIIEPIQGEGGFIEPAKGFLPAIVEYAKANGIVFVADEIQTGFCRTGQWFACDDEGIVPDLITTAKGIAGGLPLAAVTGRAEIMDAAHAGGLGGTYGGNPVACAAALGSIETMKELDLNGKAQRIGEIMLGRLRAIQEKFADSDRVRVGEVRGRGAMIAVELVKPGGKEPNPEATAAIAKACHAEGLVVLTAGTYGNVLRFLPPLVMPEHLLNEGLDIIEGAFATV